MCFLEVICFNCGCKLCQFNFGLITVWLWDVSFASRVLPQKSDFDFGLLSHYTSS